MWGTGWGVTGWWVACLAWRRTQVSASYAVTFWRKTFLFFCDNFLKKLSALLGGGISWLMAFETQRRAVMILLHQPNLTSMCHLLIFLFTLTTMFPVVNKLLWRVFLLLLTKLVLFLCVDGFSFCEWSVSFTVFSSLNLPPRYNSHLIILYHIHWKHFLVC